MALVSLNNYFNGFKKIKIKKNYYIWSNFFVFGIRYWALMAIRIKAQDNQHDWGNGVRQAIPCFALFTANPAIVLPTTNNIPQNLQVPANETHISQIQLNG